MRLLFLLILFISGAVCASAQDVTLSVDTLYARDSADRFYLTSERAKIINHSDSNYVITISRFNTDIENRGWDRSIETHQITYPPTMDSVSFVLPARDTGSVYFGYFINGVSGCVHEHYQVTSTGISVLTDTLYVEACALRTATVTDLKPETVIYPNPCKDMLGIDPLPVDAGRVSLVNLQGQEIFSSQPSRLLDLSGVPPGWYRLNVYDDNNRVILRKNIVKD